MGNPNFGFVQDSTSIAYVICLVSLITVCISAKAQQDVFNVLSYGAAGNGNTDDSLVKVFYFSASEIINLHICISCSILLALITTTFLIFFTNEGVHEGME